jgi:hypothetical protein
MTAAALVMPEVLLMKSWLLPAVLMFPKKSGPLSALLDSRTTLISVGKPAGFQIPPPSLVAAVVPPLPRMAELKLDGAAEVRQCLREVTLGAASVAQAVVG